jgi:hypothetical protein
MSDGIDTEVLAMQASAGDPAADPIPVKSRRAQLLGRDPPVLASGDCSDCVARVAHIAT